MGCTLSSVPAPALGSAPRAVVTGNARRDTSWIPTHIKQSTTDAQPPDWSLGWNLGTVAQPAPSPLLRAAIAHTHRPTKPKLRVQTNLNDVDREGWRRSPRGEYGRFEEPPVSVGGGRFQIRVVVECVTEEIVAFGDTAPVVEGAMLHPAARVALLRMAVKYGALQDDVVAMEKAIQFIGEARNAEVRECLLQVHLNNDFSAIDRMKQLVSECYAPVRSVADVVSGCVQGDDRNMDEEVQAFLAEFGSHQIMEWSQGGRIVILLNWDEAPPPTAQRQVEALFQEHKRDISSFLPEVQARWASCRVSVHVRGGLAAALHDEGLSAWATSLQRHPVILSRTFWPCTSMLNFGAIVNTASKMHNRFVHFVQQAKCTRPGLTWVSVCEKCATDHRLCRCLDDSRSSRVVNVGSPAMFEVVCRKCSYKRENGWSEEVWRLVATTVTCSTTSPVLHHLLKSSVVDVNASRTLVHMTRSTAGVRWSSPDGALSCWIPAGADAPQIALTVALPAPGFGPVDLPLCS